MPEKNVTIIRAVRWKLILECLVTVHIYAKYLSRHAMGNVTDALLYGDNTT